MRKIQRPPACTIEATYPDPTNDLLMYVQPLGMDGQLPLVYINEKWLAEDGSVYNEDTEKLGVQYVNLTDAQEQFHKSQWDKTTSRVDAEGDVVAEAEDGGAFDPL